MKQVSIIAVLLLVLFYPFVASGEMYSWIDENGVKHYTNEPPLEDATNVEKTEEIPYDEAKDQKRMERDEQYFNELKQKNRQNDKTMAEEVPQGEEVPNTVIIQEEGGDTWHQDRIEKRERVKQRHQKRRRH